MRAAAYQQFQPTRDLKPSGADVISRFGLVRLEIRLTDEEQRTVAGQVIDPAVLDAVGRYGLAEYVGGGPLVLDHYLVGQSQQPIGVACVRAAADWRRAGLTSGIPEPIAIGLIPHYLPGHRVADAAEPEAVATGLSWARERVNETVALLYRVDGRLEVFDYLLDHLQREDVPIPEPTWDAIAEAVADQPDDAYAVASNIFATGDLPQEERFLRISAGHGNSEAMWQLSMVLTEQDQLDESERWLQQFWQLDSSHGAMLNLGSAFRADGDPERAERWYRQSAEDGGPYGMFLLGTLLAEHNRPDEAERWYRRAIARADSMPWSASVSCGTNAATWTRPRSCSARRPSAATMTAPEISPSC